jgi:short-subunit dehydrogenase
MQSVAAPSRVVIITGGSSGIGLCTALLFARRGWKVGLIARNEEGLRKAAARVREAGGVAATASADVADSVALTEAAAKLQAELGPVDVWINDAGGAVISRFVDTTEDEFRRTIDVTFLGQVNGTRVALAAMRPRRRGTIIGIGSAVSFRAVPMMSAYSAAKWALRGFYEAVRAELMHDRLPIHLGLVHPPAVNTPFFSHAVSRFGDGHEDERPRPPPPVYEPELIADAIWMAVSERRRDVKVSGSTEQFAVLNTLMPGVLDRLSALLGFPAQRTSRRDVRELSAPSLFQSGNTEAVVHGPFAREAKASSLQMWLQRNRFTIGLSGIALAIAMKPARRRRVSKAARAAAARGSAQVARLTRK